MQVVAPRVARVVGSVEGDVRLVLRGRVDHQLGRRPVEEVAGAHQADRAAADRALRHPGADPLRLLGIAPVHAHVVEVGVGSRVVLGPVAAVGRERRGRPLDPRPVQPVGRDPGDHPVAHFRLRTLVVGAVLLHRPLARLALAAVQLLAGRRVEVAALLAEPLVALLGRRLGVEQDAAGRTVDEDVVGDRPTPLHLTERGAVELVAVGTARQTDCPLPAGIDDAVAAVLLVPPRRRRLHVGGILPGLLRDQQRLRRLARLDRERDADGRVEQVVDTVPVDAAVAGEHLPPVQERYPVTGIVACRPPRAFSRQVGSCARGLCHSALLCRPIVTGPWAAGRPIR